MLHMWTLSCECKSISKREKNMALHICLTGQWTHHVESLTLFCLWRQTFSVQFCTCYISQMKCFIVSDDDDETIDSRLCDCFLFYSIARHILGSSAGFFAMFANSKNVCMPKNAFQCWLCVRCALFLEEWLCTKSIYSYKNKQNRLNLFQQCDILMLLPSVQIYTHTHLSFCIIVIIVAKADVAATATIFVESWCQLKR